MENDSKLPEELGWKLSLQDMLSLGYLYLLALGIVSDSVFYSFLDINILSYSTILDVLLSPLVYLSKGPAFVLTILIIPLASILFLQAFQKYHAKNRDKEWYQKKYDMKMMDERYKKINQSKILIPALVIFSAYSGYALGSGMKSCEKLRDGLFEPDHCLYFQNGEKERVRVIGNNSEYLFYVSPQETKVFISPIKDNIRKIEQIK